MKRMNVETLNVYRSV